MVALDEQFQHGGTKTQSRSRNSSEAARSEKSLARRIIGVASPRRRRDTSISSPNSCVKFDHRRSRITDQQFRISDDLFIDHCSLIIERSFVSLCRCGENRFRFFDHCSLIFEQGADAYGNTLIFTAPDTAGNWWGDAAVQSSYGANEIVYCGYRFDPETQLYYVRNRTYNPLLGRWLTRDPIGYQDGPNTYEYVISNAANFLDTFGLQYDPKSSNLTAFGDRKATRARANRRPADWHWWNPFSWPIWHSVPVKAATEAGKHAVGGAEFCGAAEAIRPLAKPGIFANQRLDYDLTHGIDFTRDPLYLGLYAIAGGTPWQDLPPAEQQAVQNWSQNVAKSLW